MCPDMCPYLYDMKHNMVSNTMYDDIQMDVKHGIIVGCHDIKCNVAHSYPKECGHECRSVLSTNLTV